MLAGIVYLRLQVKTEGTSIRGTSGTASPFPNTRTHFPACHSLHNEADSLSQMAVRGLDEEFVTRLSGDFTISARRANIDPAGTSAKIIRKEPFGESPVPLECRGGNCKSLSRISFAQTNDVSQTNNIVGTEIYLLQPAHRNFQFKKFDRPGIVGEFNFIDGNSFTTSLIDRSPSEVIDKNVLHLNRRNRVKMRLAVQS